MTTTLRARIVLPVAQPPLNDGAVVVSGNRVASVGRWADVRRKNSGRVVDLGEAILLPGLINAHCHLDYTDMAGELVPTRHFTDWIKDITTAKASWSYTEFAQSWLNGARMLLRRGSTTVADTEAVPELLPEVWDATSLRVFSFLEMTGIRSRRDPESILRDAIETIESLPAGRNGVGLSPHAPYSTTPALLRRSAEVAAKRNYRVVTHVAESATEFEMFTQGSGEMFSWLARNERNMHDCGRGSPVRHLAECGLLSARLLAIHVNYLAEGDAELLGRHGVHVVHCPRSHDFFRHQDFPLQALTAAGVNLCLGTDSLATMRNRRGHPLELDLFREMQSFAFVWPAVPAETILKMVTVNGARALGLAGQVGEISRGAFADLIAVPWAGEARQAVEAVLHHTGDVMASMIAGRWAIKPPHL